MGLWLIEEQARLPTVFIFFSETYRINLKLTELIWINQRSTYIQVQRITIMKRLVMGLIWNHFITRFFKDWLDDYANDYSYEHETIRDKEYEDYRWSEMYWW